MLETVRKSAAIATELCTACAEHLTASSARSRLQDGVVVAVFIAIKRHPVKAGVAVRASGRAEKTFHVSNYARLKIASQALFFKVDLDSFAVMLSC